MTGLEWNEINVFPERLRSTERTQYKSQLDYAEWRGIKLGSFEYEEYGFLEYKRKPSNKFYDKELTYLTMYNDFPDSKEEFSIDKWEIINYDNSFKKVKA